MEKKNNSLVIILMGVIIIILAVLCVLFATGTISFNSNESSSNNEMNNQEVDNQNNEESVKNNSRDEQLTKLKNALSDKNWINNNLLKENAFSDKIDNYDAIELKFSVLNDNNDNPIVIVYAYNYDTNNQNNWINKVYKISCDGSNVNAELVNTGHPGHGGFSIDISQGYIISDYMHMGEMSITIHDIKGSEVKKVDYYTFSNETERINKLNEYNIRTTSISIELNNDNIDSYIK